MKHWLLASFLGFGCLMAPAAIAQGTSGSGQEGGSGMQRPAPLPVQPAPGDGGQGVGAEPRAGEQGREETVPPAQGGGCQFRERKLELIV